MKLIDIIRVKYLFPEILMRDKSYNETAHYFHAMILSASKDIGSIIKKYKVTLKKNNNIEMTVYLYKIVLE
jgi:hypothetical protein